MGQMTEIVTQKRTWNYWMCPTVVAAFASGIRTTFPHEAWWRWSCACICDGITSQGHYSRRCIRTNLGSDIKSIINEMKRYIRWKVLQLPSVSISFWKWMEPFDSIQTNIAPFVIDCKTTPTIAYRTRPNVYRLKRCRKGEFNITCHWKSGNKYHKGIKKNIILWQKPKNSRSCLAD